MKFFKNFSLWISVFVFAFLLSYQPVMLRAQSVEDLQGIHEDIGGGGDYSTSDDSDDYTLYIIVGAAVIGVALYYYLKWVEKKRPSKKQSSELNSENVFAYKFKYDNNVTELPEKEFDKLFNAEKLIPATQN